MESALNQTAERLEPSFAEFESRRQELAAMLDSMQEAVVAITPEGLVRWSNAVMQRIAGTQIRTGPAAGSVGARSGAAGLRAKQRWSSAKRVRALQFARRRAASSRLTPLRMPSGGALAVLHDITAH